MSGGGEHKHQHPRWMFMIKTRTRLIGTLNLAVAIRGASCGWGTCEKPRWGNDPERVGWGNRRRLLTIPLGSGYTTWRFARRKAATTPPGEPR